MSSLSELENCKTKNAELEEKVKKLETENTELTTKLASAEEAKEQKAKMTEEAGNFLGSMLGNENQPEAKSPGQGGGRKRGKKSKKNRKKSKKNRKKSKKNRKKSKKNRKKSKRRR